MTADFARQEARHAAAELKHYLDREVGEMKRCVNCSTRMSLTHEDGHLVYVCPHCGTREEDEDE